MKQQKKWCIVVSICSPEMLSEIQMKTGLDARILMETLMTLEMEGYIKETAKNYYVRMSDVR